MNINLKKLTLLVTACMLSVSVSLPLEANPGITQMWRQIKHPEPSVPTHRVSSWSIRFCVGPNCHTTQQAESWPARRSRSKPASFKEIGSHFGGSRANLENVVKTEVYLKDLKDFPAMNALYGENFSIA